MGALKLATEENKIKECLNSAIIKLNKASYVEEAEKFIQLIHGNNTGYMAFLQKEKGIGTQYMVKDIFYNQLHNLTHFKDLYMSINSFYIPKRTTDCVRQLNAFWVDLDYYKIPKYAKKTPTEMIEILRKKKLFKKIEPSFFIASGGGMYIFYLIKDMPKQMATMWSKVELAMANSFEEFGADMGATDISRVLRLPGTINTKTGKRAYIIYNNKSQYNWENPIETIKRYTFKEIQEVYLPDIKKDNKKEVVKENKPKKICKVTTLFTLKNLHHKRLLDIESIVKYRNGEMCGCRHNTLYIYLITNLHFDGDIENAIEKSENLNMLLTEPLDVKDIDEMINTAIRAYKKFVEASRTYTPDRGSFVYYIRAEANCVLYSNLGIINRLGITPTEMEELNLKTLINEDVKVARRSKTDKKRYIEKLKEEGKKTKKEELEEVYCKIKNLRVEGFKNKKIAEVLNLPVKTLERHITSMKKNGLL